MSISYNGTLSKTGTLTGSQPGIQFGTATTLPSNSFAIVAVRWEGGGASDAATFSLTSGGGDLTWSDPVYINAGGASEDQRLGFIWAKAPSGGSITPGVTFSANRTLPHIMQLVFEYTGDDVSLADLDVGSRGANGTGWSIAALDGLTGDTIVAIVSNYNGATPISAPSGYDSGVASTLLFSFYETAGSDGEINISGSTSDSYAGHGLLFREVTAAPALTSPSVTDLQPTTATANITTDTGSGTIYALYSTNATEDAADIKTGGESQAVTTAGEQSIALTGLPLGEAGYVHFVQTADGQDSNVVSYGFTTASKMTQSTTATIALPSGYSMVELADPIDQYTLHQLQRSPQVGWQLIMQDAVGAFQADGDLTMTGPDVYDAWIIDELGKMSRIIIDNEGLSAAIFPEAPTFSNVTGVDPEDTGSQSFTLTVTDYPEEEITIQAVGVGATVRNGVGAAASSVTGVDGDTIYIDWVASAEFSTPETFGVDMTGGVSSYFTVTTRAPIAPTITVHPAADTVSVGGTAEFSITASNAASYIWYIDNVAVDGETTNSLSIDTTGYSVGSYDIDCDAVSTEGGVTSATTTTLTVQAAAATFTSAEPLADINTKAILANTEIDYILIKAGGAQVSGTATTDANGYLSDTSSAFGAADDNVRIVCDNDGSNFFTGFKAVLT